MLRLALVYALLDRPAFIDAPHLRAALACWDYAEASARFVFGDTLGDPMADEILRALRGRPEGLTRTELIHHFGRHLSSEQLDRALAVLARGNFARANRDRPPAAPSSAGGPPDEPPRLRERRHALRRKRIKRRKRPAPGLSSHNSLTSQRCLRERQERVDAARGRTDPEEILMSKQPIARDLRRLAAEVQQ